MSSKILMIHH